MASIPGGVSFAVDDIDPQMPICDPRQRWRKKLPKLGTKGDIIVAPLADIRSPNPLSVVLGHTCALKPSPSACSKPQRSIVFVDTEGVDQSLLPTVLAHEIGHGLGLSHQDGGCGEFKPTDSPSNLMDVRIPHRSD